MKETQRAETEKRSGARLRYFLAGLAILLLAAEVLSVAFSPNGKTLASGSVDKTVKLWDAQTRLELATLKGHDGHVYSIAFSPNGKVLASGSTDYTVKLWDARTGQELATLYGHDYSVNSVAFSPDGKTLASGSTDYTVKLWVGDGRQRDERNGRSSPFRKFKLAGQFFRSRTENCCC